jgi:pimeloyl-ACP methyl ester carboxylesterase
MRLPAPLALLVGAGLLLAAAPSAGAAIAYAPCNASSPLQCGFLDVPLDRGGTVAGTVRLAAVRKVAPSNPGKIAVVGLVGGPGGAAIPFVPDFTQLLAPALTSRDLLMFDPRGIRASSPVACLSNGTSTEAGARCAGQLGARRGLFTTATVVEDLEALRAESGYEKLVLVGVSYGTKVALDYAARHPDRVEALVLDSVVLPEGEDPLQRSTFAAMRRSLAELCAGGACSGISGNPLGDVAQRVSSLARRPLRGTLTTDRGGHERVEINREDLFGVILGGDRNPTLRAELPAALTSAKRGDSAPLIRLVARSIGIISLRRQAADSEFNEAIFAATLCEEGAFPWDRTASSTTRAQQINAYARGLGEAVFSPFDSATALTSEIVKRCIGWPVASPPSTPAGPLPNVPTLVLDGTADVRTPLEDAVKVKALIPAAQVISIPFGGHSVMANDFGDEQCAARAVRQFFSGQPVAPCAPSQNPFSPTPVAPTRFQGLRPSGPGGKIGRTVTAAVFCAQDMRRQVIGDLLSAGQLPRRAGGLRGGRVVVARGIMTLFDVTFVPGVKVSGTVPIGAGREVLRVGGSKAAHGRIIVTATTITGHLGGRRIGLTAQAAGVPRRPSEPPLETLLRHVRLRGIS